MQLAFDQYTLALSVLDGEPDAHRLLADLLDEHGERGLAQWARAGKAKRQRRLDFVIAVLPANLSVSLASEFLGYALAPLEEAQNLLHNALTPIRQWAAAPAGDPPARALAALASSTPWIFGVRDVDRASQSLHMASALLRQSLEFYGRGDNRLAMQAEREASNAARRCITMAREIGKSERVASQWRTGRAWSKQKQTRLRTADQQYQTERIRETLLQLVAAGDGVRS
jgi:hypothetical protein